jgi:FlgD Ig-like domain
VAAAAVAFAAGAGAGCDQAVAARAGGTAAVSLPSTVIPAVRMTVPRSAGLVAGDGKGYLSATEARFPSGSMTWVGDDGSTREGMPEAVAFNGGYGLERVQGSTTGYRIRHYVTGKSVRVDVPAGDTATGMFSARRLVTLRQANGRWTLHILEVPDGGGTPVDRLVTGVPADMGPAVETPTSDARGAAFWYKPPGGGGTWRTGLLDFASARLTLVPSDGYGVLEYPRLAADKVVFLAVDAKFTTKSLYVVDRDHPERPGTAIATLDGVKDFQTETATVGDWLVYVRPNDPARAVRAVPLAGGAPRTLLPRSRDLFVTAGDGSLLVEGGADARHWAVRKITAGADGAPAVATKAALGPVSVWEVGGFAVDQGRVLLATEYADATEQYSGTFLSASALTLAADGTLSAAPPGRAGDLGTWYPGDDSGDPGSSGYYVPCYGECLRLTGTGESDVAHQTYEAPGVVAVAGTYRVVRPAGASQQVLDGTKVLSTGPVRAAALWGSTLWTPGTARGTVTAASLPSLRKGATVEVGATCVPRELQVVGRWVYWSCGPDGDAGVYDTTAKRLIHVPSGYAELADGYLVSQDTAARELMITYFPGAVDAGQAGTRPLGPLPSPVHTPDDRRGRFWAVDRFGGAIAYLRAQGDVAVRWPHVRTSGLAVIASSVPPTLDTWTHRPVKGVWNLSRPAAGWELTIRRQTTGKTVATVTGGPARGRITASWNGTADGATVPAGTYTWTLKAEAADGAGQAATASGAFAVRTVRPRDYDGG